MNPITFVKASLAHQQMIFSWLAEPHMMAFWDNSQAHKDDIENFLHGRKQHYFAGTTHYFIGLVDEVPYSFLLGDRLLPTQAMPELYRQYLSASGHTIAIDFGIGNPAYLGKGLAAATLEAFIAYYRNTIDSKADTFFIDPSQNNPKAKRAYAKAGFELVGQYIAQEGAFTGHSNLLMVKKIARARMPSRGDRLQ